MAAEEQIPGDVISMGGSDSEEENSQIGKRSLADVDGPDGQDDQPCHTSKRAKFSRPSLSSDPSKASEEGEIEESFSKSIGSQSGQSDGQPAAKSFVPSDPPLFTTDTVSLKLPALSQKKEGSWCERVLDWSTVLCTINFESLADIKPPTVVSAFCQYVDVHSGLKPPKKRTAKQTVRAMEESGQIANVITFAKPPPPAPAQKADDVEDGQVADSPEYEPSEPAQVENGQQTNGHANHVVVSATNGDSISKGGPTAEQRRYFPSAENAADMCVLCGRKGHVADACSHTKCKFCGETGHWQFACKAIQARCDKCRQLGHDTSTCVEKLALTKDEGLACAYCGMEHHLEGECTEPWRSFHAEGDVVLPVVAIQASCAVCGSRNHFASDCSQKGSRPFNPSWTLRNRDLFIDPKCGNESIEEAASLHLGAKPKKGRQQAKMPRGAPSRAINVHYSESDDSDMDLLSHRAAARQQRPPVGRMQMSTNIQMPTLGGHAVQPPLPPGPPPPLPPSSYPPPPGTTSYGKNERGPPPSLPPKPPAARNSRGPLPPPPKGDVRRGGYSRGRGGPPRGRGGRGGGGGGGGGGGRGRGRR
ncbi:hypothetical protein G3M48_003602 [Beauveria asiatica]|uniref:CCHC-type domain-containing protein n=1 Tax=Beauveria asiatica TaxID=1069075 RepID=A0AAW0RWD1_9HYPO